MTEPTPSTIGDLGVDILSMIFEYINDTSPETISKVEQVNLQFHGIAGLLKHHNKSVSTNTLKDSEAAKMIWRWSEDSVLLRTMRHLTVEYLSLRMGRMERFEKIPHTQFALSQLIESLSNLRSLTWNIDTPIFWMVVSALQQHHPRAELKITAWVRFHRFQRWLDIFDHTLVNSTSLTSLTAEIDAYQSHGDIFDYREAVLKRIISSAPNLRHVAITRTQTSPVASTEEEATYVSKGIWKSQMQPNSNITSFSLDGFDLSRETLADWERFVDLGALKSFACTHGLVKAGFFGQIASSMTHLQSVNLNLGSFPFQYDRVNAFFNVCPRLTSLSIWSWDGIDLDMIIGIHGASLRKLELHQEEDFANPPRRVLNLAQLAGIRNACPLLVGLSIDMNRTKCAPDVGDFSNEYQILRTIDLHHLQVYHDLGLTLSVHTIASIHNAALRPDFRGAGVLRSTSAQNRAYVNEAWKLIFAHRSVGDRTLTVKFGEWETKNTFHSQHSGRTLWVAAPRDRDGARATCTVKKWVRS